MSEDKLLIELDFAKSRIVGLERQIGALERDFEKLRSQFADYNSKAEELKALYPIIKEKYEKLSAKLENQATQTMVKLNELLRLSKQAARQTHPELRETA